MDPATTTRLTNLLAMTTSPHDGEALNACRLAWKLMKEIGINYQELVEPRAMPLDPQARQEAYQRGYADGLAQGRREAKPSPASRPAPWRAIVEEMLEQITTLTEWEQSFLQSFLERRWHTPTERQRAVLEKIASKLGLKLPDGSPGPPPPWLQPNGEPPW